MLSLEALTAYGADTGAGLRRCMNNESFYLRLVGMVPTDKNFEALRAALSQGDRRAAFAAAHALKGAVGNLALTPLYACAGELTELLRGEGDFPAEAAALGARLLALRDDLAALAA